LAAKLHRWRARTPLFHLASLIDAGISLSVREKKLWKALIAAK